MKKICMLQNSLTYGGTDTFVINLCNGLVRDGYDVTVILSVDKVQDLPREKELVDTGCRIVKTCALNSIKSKLRHLKLLYKELKQGKYDVFQSNIDLFNGPQMLVAWLAGVPLRECHSHNSQQGRELSEGMTLSIKVYQRIMRWLCWTFSNRRCGCSESALDFLFNYRWKKDASARIIHNGIDLFEYQKSVDIAKKKQELGLTNQYNICAVGRISYQKNPEFLLETFYEVSKTRNDIDLIWCGTGDLQDAIREKINDLGLTKRVHLLGGRSDIPEVLACSNLFLLPSRFEGLGIVLVEAQAASLPCVISDVIPKEVDCGLCLAISLEQSAEYWAKQIVRILDGELVFKLNAQKLNTYSIDNMVKEMEEVFES
ncbi:glycosyltransferase [uncultured Flavonifractor sp.]|uniref:glycosyltransferase n=1 Tax=uncultured Flavonifractor sp. TaxID=1193534 RepID=UPI0026213556|nr:glycosyltransferase [uncultured Flavonifractor sp.]